MRAYMTDAEYENERSKRDVELAQQNLVTCDHCGNVVPWTEAEATATNGTMCDSCCNDFYGS